MSRGVKEERGRGSEEGLGVRRAASPPGAGAQREDGQPGPSTFHVPLLSRHEEVTGNNHSVLQTKP